MDPSQKYPAISAQSERAQPELADLTDSERFVLRRLRSLDSGNGCAVSYRDLGKGKTFSISPRQMRRIISELAARGLVRKGQKLPSGPLQLFVKRSTEQAA